MDIEKNRVYCLYRVSTDKQVDYNEKNQADIPMQRKICHRFAEEHGWTIVHEEQEDGISGHKVRAANRDKLQIIKEDAKKGLFDILLVFMFDRIGRIADETPFVVEWFVKNGISVWSTQEGEQRFDNHTDKLINYIRFWQADGESEKTSVRTKTALGLLVEEGSFKGGNAAYGYDLVPSGHLNKRKHEVLKLVINESEAAVVRMIYDKYVQDGFGAQHIATELNRKGYRARSGKMWHPASIRGILVNLTYTGILRSGESRSPVLPELQIISTSTYEKAQAIRAERRRSIESESARHFPLKVTGKSLLSGCIFCGHCGSRLTLTTNGRYYPTKAEPNRIVQRVRYVCYGKTRKQTDCDGQTGYTAHILDDIVSEIIKQIFVRMKTIPKNEIINAQYSRKISEQKALVKSAQDDCNKIEKEITSLRSEVVKSISGHSSFSSELLNSLITEKEEAFQAANAHLVETTEVLDNSLNFLKGLTVQYDDVMTWAEAWDAASFEKKKMIISYLIKRIDVYRGYKVHIEFNIDFKQFLEGLD